MILESPAVLLAGYRGPYRPRRPVFQYPPAGLRVFYKPEHDPFGFPWERCCVCRRDFRVVYPEGYEGADLFVLSCSARCASRPLVGEDIRAARRRPRETKKIERTRAEYEAYLARLPEQP